jgi:hypothetical protein
VSNGRKIVDNELGTMWKEAVADYCKVISEYSPGDTEEIRRISVNTVGLSAKNQTWDLQNMKQEC